MAIFGIGAYYDEDVSQRFITANIIGVGWNLADAPELHQYITTLKVGDIVYIKSFSPSSPNIFVKAIGIIIDDVIVDLAMSNSLVACGRRVHWVSTQEFTIPKPMEKNNVRNNTIYEEFHPVIQQRILSFF